MSDTLTARKVKNRLSKVLPGLVYKLKDEKDPLCETLTLGCHGFIENPATGDIVYIITTPSCYGPLSKLAMWRRAKSFTDFTGGTNMWVETGGFIDALATALQEGEHK